MTDYNLKMKSSGDGNFVVRCGMRTPTSPEAHFWLKCDSLPITDETGNFSISSGGINPSIVSGVKDNAYSYTGSSSYEKNITGSNNIVNGGLDFSINFWISMASNYDSMSILSDEATGVLLAGAVYVVDRLILFRMLGGSLFITLPDSSFHMVSITVDSSGYGKMYLNGELETSSSGFTPDYYSDTVSFTKPSGAVPPSAALKLDDFRIYDKTLSQQEITNLYNSY